MAGLRARGLGVSSVGYEAPAEGLLSGLERGVGLYRSLIEAPEREAQARKEREEDRRFLNLERSWRIADRTRAEEERQRSRLEGAEQQELSAQEAQAASMLRQLDAQQKALSDQANSALNTYGSPEKIPAELRSHLGQKFRELQSQFDSWRKQIQAVADRKVKSATDALSRVSKADSPEKADPADLRRALALTGIPTEYILRGEDGSPSKVESALADAARGIETGDRDAIVAAANVLLVPELRRGLYSPGADGTPITSKEVVGVIPHPDDPKKVSFALRIRTAGNPQGYIAPVSQRRTSDPSDPPAFFDIDSLLEHGAKLSQLSQSINDSGAAERLRQASQREDAMRGIPDEMLFAVLGVKPDIAKANIAAETRQETAKTSAAARVASAAARTGRSPGQTAQQPKKEKYLTKFEIEKLIDAEAGEYGLFRDGGKWFQKDPSGRRVPASPDSMVKLSEITSNVLSRAVKGKVGAPLQSLPRNREELVDDEVYVAPDGRVVLHVGNGKFRELGRSSGQ